MSDKLEQWASKARAWKIPCMVRGQDHLDAVLARCRARGLQPGPVAYAPGGGVFSFVVLMPQRGDAESVRSSLDDFQDDMKPLGLVVGDVEEESLTCPPKQLDG